MTTIAIKDNIVAFDSMVECCGTKIGSVVKVKKFVSNYYIREVIAGFSGDLRYMDPFFKFVDKGEKFEAPEENCINAFVIIEGRILLVERNLLPYSVESEFFAFGSGSDFALGAMAAGASADESVLIASQLDCYTGYKIHHLTY